MSSIWEKNEMKHYLFILFLISLLMVNYSCDSEKNGKELLLAIDKDDANKVQQLLEIGTDVNYYNKLVYKGMKPIIVWAYSSRDIKILNLLLEAGADPNTVYNAEDYKGTVLDALFSGGSEPFDQLKLLIQNGAKTYGWMGRKQYIDQRTSYLNEAINNHWPKIVQYILSSDEKYPVGNLNSFDESDYSNPIYNCIVKLTKLGWKNGFIDSPLKYMSYDDWSFSDQFYQDMVMEMITLLLTANVPIDIKSTLWAKNVIFFRDSLKFENKYKIERHKEIITNNSTIFTIAQLIHDRTIQNNKFEAQTRFTDYQNQIKAKEESERRSSGLIIGSLSVIFSLCLLFIPFKFGLGRLYKMSVEDKEEGSYVNPDGVGNLPGMPSGLAHFYTIIAFIGWIIISLVCFKWGVNVIIKALSN